jgi:hypothetical protein
MALQAAVQFAKRCQFRNIEVSSARKNAVPNRANVPIGQKKQVFTFPVHAPVARVNLHLFEIQLDQEICAAQRATRVSRAGAMDHSNDVAADLSAEVAECGGRGHEEVFL